MKLHLSTSAPWIWAANWQSSPDAPSTVGAVEHIDPDGHGSWPSRILHALAEASLAYEDETGELPAEVELHLSSIQAAGAGDILRKLDLGPWETRDETRLACVLLAKGIRVTVRPSTRADMAIMREAKELVGRSVAVDLMAGMGVARG